jgi:ferrochelatase
MAYGGPESLDELPGYLADIRSGRPTTKAVLDEMRRNYTLIGGKSPLLAITRQQGAALEQLLNQESGVRAWGSGEGTEMGSQRLEIEQEGVANAQDSAPETRNSELGTRNSLSPNPQPPTPTYRVYYGMRHWSPWIEETVREMINDGIKQAVALVLAPHYSGMSVARYRQKVEAGLKMYDGKIEFEYVDSYYNVPKLIQAFVNRVREGISRFPQAERENVHVVFSAHSLPTRILKTGDPYQDQLFETARLVAEGAGLKEDQWSWSYQSAGRTPEPWLGPQIENYVAELAGKGIKNVVSVPVGFVSDHVELLFDIDIKAQKVAHEKGVRLERPPALNLDPLYIETLADLVRERSAKWVQANTKGSEAK